MNTTEILIRWNEESGVTSEMLAEAKLSVGALDAILKEYLRVQPEYERAAEALAAWFHDKGLQEYVHSVRYRTKDPVHLADKIYRKAVDKQRPRIVSADTLVRLITDLAGVRVILLYRNDWKHVDRFVADRWPPEERIAYLRADDEEDEFITAGFDVARKRIGYRSLHYVVIEANSLLPCEIQVRSIFDEGWAEIDHRLRYPSLRCRPEVDAQLRILNKVASLADDIARELRKLSEFDLARVLRTRQTEMVPIRERLWRASRAAARHLAISDLPDLLGRVGMPPGLPLQGGHWRDHADHLWHATALSVDQQQVRKLAGSVYFPEDEEPLASLPENVSLEMDEARRPLAKWWDTVVKEALDVDQRALDRIGQNIDSAAHEIYLLSWMETALIRKTRDPGLGKFGLFKMGQWFGSHGS